eukprot:764657-Hanusia_phi.AAC.1
MSLCALVLCLPIFALRKRFFAGKSESERKGGHQEEGLFDGVNIIWFFLAVSFSVLAYIVASNVGNSSFVLLHAVWRILLYLSAWSFLVSCSAIASVAAGSERLLGDEFVTYDGANGI